MRPTTLQRGDILIGIKCTHANTNSISGTNYGPTPSDACLLAEYWRDVVRILQTKLLVSTAFHPDMDGLSEKSNQLIVCNLCGFATNDQATWDDYL